MAMSEVLSRIHTQEAELDSKFAELAERHGIGLVRKWSVINSGLEDCNFYIKTDAAEYLLKIFAKDRESADLDRYVEIMNKLGNVQGLNVQHIVPTLSGTPDGWLEGKQDRYVLCDWIQGDTFFALGRMPNETEFDNLMSQVGILHALDFRPDYSFDSWQVGNITKMYDRVQEFLNAEERQLAQYAVERFGKVNHEDLPHAFVHGDLTQQNVILMPSGEVGIIDFSVSNWYPRIQELAIIVANLLYDRSKTGFNAKLYKVVEQYSKYIKLESKEKEALASYTIAAMAMEFLGSCQEKYLKGGELPEIEYWLTLGKEGLREALADSK